MNEKLIVSPFEYESEMNRLDLEPLSKEDGYRWGIIHLQYIQEELRKLEARAIERQDIEFFNQVRISLKKAQDAEEELKEKLAVT
jgi:hypothetical protein